ncbi:replicative DNA helicase [Patescibacteria group bacterium]|nr:replicative DNA helicase [Patescibacteria group bacterium]
MPDLKHAKRQAPASVDRLPPHSSEAEQAVLGCILFSPSTAVASLATCIEAFKDGELVFYDLRHQTIYRICLELYEDQIEIDVVTLSERLKIWELLEQVGGIVYISSLPDSVPSIENLSEYIQIVKDKYVLRRMIQTCTEVVGRIYDHEGEIDELMDTAERDVLRISESRAETVSLSMPVLVHQVLDDIESAQHNNGQPSGLTTGFVDFDKMTGGLTAGQMMLIAARPSMGKSSLAMNIAEHVALNLHLGVGVCSLEMTAKELTQRMVASRSRVNLRNMRTGFLCEADYPRITNAAGLISHAPIYIDDTSGQSILAIRAKMRRWWQAHEIKLGIIDYLQLANALGSKRKFESRQQEVSDISVGVKNLAKELGIPIIALSQMNRDFEREKNRKPRLSDLRESGSLEQDADIVCFLYKPQEFEDDNEDFAYPVNLLVAKQRSGPTGDIPLTFLKSYTRFESAAKVSDDDVPPHQQPEINLNNNHEPQYADND